MWAGNQGFRLGLGESWKGALAHTDEPPARAASSQGGTVSRKTQATLTMPSRYRRPCRSLAVEQNLKKPSSSLMKLATTC